MTWSLLFTRSSPGPLIVSDDPLRGLECVVDAETYRSLNIPIYQYSEDEVKKKSREAGANEEFLAGGS